MNKETIEKIIKEYKTDKQHKGFCTIIMNDGRTHGQTPVAHNPLERFELMDDETLIIEHDDSVQYLSIANITEINLRAKYI